KNSKVLWEKAVRTVSKERKKYKLSSVAISLVDKHKIQNVAITLTPPSSPKNFSVNSLNLNSTNMNNEKQNNRMNNDVKIPIGEDLVPSRGTMESKLDLLSDCLSQDRNYFEETYESTTKDFATVFKKGLMYKGIYWPSLTNSFHCKHLELAYLRYSHRQRQKALIIVNIVDLLLK
ncbi:hypothetical protein GWI33_023075, partial [Rhynchophorus ferrugineus]